MTILCDYCGKLVEMGTEIKFCSTWEGTIFKKYHMHSFCATKYATASDEFLAMVKRQDVFLEDMDNKAKSLSDKETR